MSEGWVFWKRPLRVSGPCAPEVALSRLRALLAPSTRFSSEERLVGRIDGPRVRIWKRTLLSGSSDVVQFEGAVLPDGGGCAFDGTLGYNAATRLQFIGFLAAGLLIAGAGLMQKMAGSETANDVILFGSVTALVTLAWIGASSHMKEKQVEFVEAKLREIVATPA
jgi:hypothetical protein